MTKPLWLLLYLFAHPLGALVWPLPQESDSGLHYLCKAIINAHKKVLIISPQIEGYRLKEALRKSAAKGTQISLFVASPQTITSLALFSSVSLYIASIPIHTTIVQIDTTTSCSLNMPLTESSMAIVSGMLTCNPFVAEAHVPPSHPYLEE